MVHIKKVDIFGFKSFGFKTTSVNFEPGLVSISGPNGSGKSNILDAIIFAMGENKLFLFYFFHNYTPNGLM